MESIIVAKKKINDFDDLEETMNTYNAYLDPDGTWWKKNKDEEGAINNAKLLVQASLAFLANTYHRRAQDTEKNAEYVKAPIITKNSSHASRKSVLLRHELLPRRYLSAQVGGVRQGRSVLSEGGRPL